ncbi:MAG: RNA-binding transcriptional accessory protein [Actinobacteria bacterium]|nr:RNA-binding transcriptional accessory protein [Actinomycetota bacterium]
MTNDAIFATVAAALDVRPAQVAAAVKLFDEKCTIPFVARYRKEVTGGLDEVLLEQIQDRVAYLRALSARKEEVRKTIEEQGKLTPELAAAIEVAATLQQVEDLYLPYRPKRRTRASIARERGLEPLATLILTQARPEASLSALALPFVNEETGLASEEEVWAGARDIVAEVLAEDAAVRGALREAYAQEALLAARRDESVPDPQGKYAMYYEYAEPLERAQPHRVLALNRAEREGVLKVAVDLPPERALGLIAALRPADNASPFAGHLREACEDACKRLLAPSLEREVRAALTERAEQHAIAVFAANLRPLLLQPPIRGRTVLGIDPGYVTGCKLAVVDETGRYLAGTTIYPHPPQGRTEEAKREILRLCETHQVDVIAIGNGTASRETEVLVADVIANARRELAYVMVSEAGASVYSASTVAREEFPDLEAAQRGNISIARRLQDPLAELVKIDPKSIGVGLYQHDVDQKALGTSLQRVVESCVNHVGVDVNTASASLLQYVSGINRRVAESIVAYRNQHGKFRRRTDLRKVPGMGKITFQQAAGFLKIAEGEDPLDNTSIHPESYEACAKLLRLLAVEAHDPVLATKMGAFRRQLERSGDAAVWAAEIGVGVPTLLDMLRDLEKPGRDPRDELPRPVLRKDVLRMEDLQEGMVLTGTVRNVVDFGAFVDIGVKQDGLLHVSEMKGPRARPAMERIAVGDVVEVRVLRVDHERGRIALSMK